MNAEPSTGYLKLLKDTTPLDFDPALVFDYLNCFKSDGYKAGAMDELEHYYEEMDKTERNKRLELMQAIGKNLFFSEDDVEENEEPE